MISQRPAPVLLDAHDERFWEYVSQRELRLQGCQTCAFVRFPAGPVCPRCLSEGGEWTAMGGRGRIISWATFRRGYFDEMPPPYTIVVARLDEGPLVLADLLDEVEPSSLSIDAAVELVFSEVASGESRWTIYQWRVV